MAGTATKLHIPYIYHGLTCYGGFLKTIFLANGQNKSLMDKEVIDQAWAVGLRSQKKELGADKMQRLLTQVSRRNSFLYVHQQYHVQCSTHKNIELFDRLYRPENLHIPKPGLAEAGIKQIDVNGVTINVPLLAFIDLSNPDYVRFVQYSLPRANPPSLRLNKEMGDAAWNKLVTHASRSKPDPAIVRNARNQVQSSVYLKLFTSLTNTCVDKE